MYTQITLTKFGYCPGDSRGVSKNFNLLDHIQNTC